jgi:hypothetical protein
VLLWLSLLESGAAGDDDGTAGTGTDELMIVLLKACILSHFRWAECEPIVGRAEVADAGWLAPVLKFRQPSGELQCIKTACARYAVSVDQGVDLSFHIHI